MFTVNFPAPGEYHVRISCGQAEAASFSSEVPAPLSPFLNHDPPLTPGHSPGIRTSSSTTRTQ